MSPGAFYKCYCLIHGPAISSTSSVTTATGMYRECSNLVDVQLFDTSSVTSFESMFYSCYSLTTIPAFNTSHVAYFSSCFYNCGSLANIPVFDFSSVNNNSLAGMMGGGGANRVKSLTNQSLDNLLASLITATNYTGTKELASIFGSNMRDFYPVTTIQSLTHYQDFIDAGWTIGWT